MTNTAKSKKKGAISKKFSPTASSSLVGKSADKLRGGLSVVR